LAVATSEDPVELVQAAARDHIPVDPKLIAANSGTLPKNPKVVPKSEERPAISEVLDEIVQAEWYRNQIVHRESFDAKVGQQGVWNLIVE
jgi:DEAD/DEAH box helicase domain-containing protein